MTGTIRTEAARRRNTALNRVWAFPVVAVLAIVATTSYPSAGIWPPGLVLVLGGAVVGVLVARDPARPHLGWALLAPLPVLAVAGLLMVGLSESNDDYLEVGWVLALTLLLFDVPLALVSRYFVARDAEHLLAPASKPGPTDLDRELDRATDHGRAVTAIREYIDDEEGRRHRDLDVTALDARGYTLTSMAHSGPGIAEAGLALALGGDVRDTKYVATYRLRSAPEAEAPVQPSGPIVDALRSAVSGFVGVGLVVAWTVAGMVVMVVGLLVLNAIQPDLVSGTPLSYLLFISGLAVAFLGSVRSIRWLRGRRS